MNTKEELFKDIENHILSDNKPSEYISSLADNEIFMSYPFDMIYKLRHVEQSPVHHPEGSVWNHTMMVLDQAAKVRDKSQDSRIFMWAALLHDIGKAPTTKIRKGRITSYDHDSVGADLAKKFLEEFTDDKEFIDGVSALVRWHMQILFVVNKLPFADIKGMKSQVNINEVALLGYCDRMGRTNSDSEKEKRNIELFIAEANNKKI
ncbi:MAG: HDIG domain-containing protein [Clostridium sp.]